MKKANAEAWAALRSEADSKATAKAQQRTADLAADNATLAQNIKRDMLKLIQRTLEAYPEEATDIKTKKGNDLIAFKLKDLADAFKTLTADMTPTNGEGSELLQSLIELERNHD